MELPPSVGGVHSSCPSADTFGVRSMYESSSKMKTGTAMSPTPYVKTLRVVSRYSELVAPCVTIGQCYIRTACDLECKNGGEVRRAELLELSLESETALEDCWEVRWWYWAGECRPCCYGCVAWCLKDVRLLLIHVFAIHTVGGTYYLVRETLRPRLTGHTSTLIRAQGEIYVEAIALVLDCLQRLFEQLIECRVSKAVDGPVRRWLNRAVWHRDKLRVHKPVEIERQVLYAASADVSQ